MLGSAQGAQDVSLRCAVVSMAIEDTEKWMGWYRSETSFGEIQSPQLGLTRHFGTISC